MACTIRSRTGCRSRSSVSTTNDPISDTVSKIGKQTFAARQRTSAARGRNGSEGVSEANANCPGDDPVSRTEGGPPRRRYYDVARLRLLLHRSGSGSPAVAFLPGGGRGQPGLPERPGASRPAHHQRDLRPGLDLAGAIGSSCRAAPPRSPASCCGTVRPARRRRAWPVLQQPSSASRPTPPNLPPAWPPTCAPPPGSRTPSAPATATSPSP